MIHNHVVHACIVGLASLSATAMAANLTAEAQQFEAKYRDFACDVDNGGQLERGDLDPRTVTPEQLVQRGEQDGGQEAIDRLYARLTSGPIPKGFYDGKIVFGKSENSVLIDKFLGTLGFPPDHAQWVKLFGETLWHGKTFNHQSNATVILGNLMPLGESQLLWGNDSGLGPNVSLNNRRAVGLARIKNNMQNPDKNLPPPTQGPDGKPILNDWRFPAKVYCGQSLLDSRRESIIIDYAFSETVKDEEQDPKKKIAYFPAIDHLADRLHLEVRDEIRMVRPGLYLGRAYMSRVFILNFTLECAKNNPFCGETMALEGTEKANSCSIGTQRAPNNPQLKSGGCTSMAEFRQ